MNLSASTPLSARVTAVVEYNSSPEAGEALRVAVASGYDPAFALTSGETFHVYYETSTIVGTDGEKIVAISRLVNAKHARAHRRYTLHREIVVMTANPRDLFEQLLDEMTN